MSQGQTVLVVDDDPTILTLMRDFLEADGFTALGASGAGPAQDILAHQPVDCVLLDVTMPGLDGFEFCRRLRATSDVPILFLSARDEDYDKIRGLGIGGDDYIVKSSTPSEVVARIKAVLRRAYVREARPAALLRFGRLSLDIGAHQVAIDGQPVALTAREFELLRLFAEHPRQIFTREQLFQRFWGDIGDRHTVTVHIGRIREKIETNPNRPEHIVTVWGVGYRFEGRPS